MTFFVSFLAGFPAERGKTMISEGMMDNATTELAGVAAAAAAAAAAANLSGALVAIGDGNASAAPTEDGGGGGGGGGGAAMESVAGIIATSVLLGIMTLITIVGE